MKSKIYLFVSLLLAFLTSCSQDSMDDNLSNNDITLEQALEDAALSDEALACYDAEGSGIVPNGECLIGAIVKAGEQFGVHWEIAIVKQFVDLYLHKPSLDPEGNVIGNPSNPRTLKLFLKAFFDYSQYVNLEDDYFKSKIGTEYTAIAIVKNKDEQNSGHAYTVLRSCNKHKGNCYICYDSVSGSEDHIKSSEFAENFAFILAEPKRTPNFHR